MNELLAIFIFVIVCVVILIALALPPKKKAPVAALGHVICVRCSTDNALSEFACVNCGKKSLKIETNPGKKLVICSQCWIEAKNLPCKQCKTDLIQLFLKQ
jgi:hypothetical protein